VGAAGSERLSEPLDSPYAPPASRLVAPPSELRLASLGQRFVNSLLDTLVLNVASVFLLLLAGQSSSLLASFAISNLTVFAYYVVLESRSGRTLGKLVTGTAVVGEDGGKPDLGQVVGRTLARLIPFEPFSFLGKKPVGWHDSLSRTRVIRMR
jgi:uncharacterized RDD family membrane protein YckC